MILKYCTKTSLILISILTTTQAYSAFPSAIGFGDASGGGSVAVTLSPVTVPGDAPGFPHFTIGQTTLIFYNGNDCSGGTLATATIDGSGYSFNNGATVTYDGASAWSQAIDVGITDPSTVQSINFQFCGTAANGTTFDCTAFGSLICFNETCNSGRCTSVNSVATIIGSQASL